MSKDRKTTFLIQSDQALKDMAEAMQKAGWEVFDITFDELAGSVSGEAAGGLEKPDVIFNLTAEKDRRGNWSFVVETTPASGEQKFAQMPTPDQLRQA